MWFSKSPAEVISELGVDPASGLSTSEVQTRLKRFGENKLNSTPPKSLLVLFLAQLKDMLIYVLLGAAAITVVIGEYVDAVIILFVVFLNAAIGVFQEQKSKKAIEALQRLSTAKTLVKRNGILEEIDSTEIVPGDIIILDAGRFVPADIRLISSSNLQIEESALTGESVPSEKNATELLSDPKTPLGDKINMAFMSTLVTNGRAEGVVTATAMNTEIGKIAKILEEHTDEMTPLQIRLEELGKILGYLAIGICSALFLIGLVQGQNVFDIFLIAISLAVAAIPEGLAAIVAIVLALGVTRMSKINAIVRKLPAVETLGSVNIICSDKTGTLTQNKMTVVQLYTMDNLRSLPVDGTQLTAGEDEKNLLKTMVLCSDATLENGQTTGDPTEVALVILGDRFQIGQKPLNSGHSRVQENPFDSKRKLMSTLNREGPSYRVHTKGALDNLLKLSTSVLVNGRIVPLTEKVKAEFMHLSNQMSEQSLRVLGAAFKDVASQIPVAEMESGLTLLGMVGMIDPPRSEVKASIAEAKAAGITPVMITGDHKNTAMAIAKELGIAESAEQSISGAEIEDLEDLEFSRLIQNYRVFARVSPEHKVKIVKAYKDNGNIVSMTGDGVNDAPALKIADIGVAMGITGTDVSKSASDMILTDDNFTTIVHAIEEGRNIYNNIRKSVIFLLSCNLGEVITIFLSVLLSWPVPLLATQILWINLITDTLPAIALGVDPGDKDVMKNKPRDPKESFFAQGAATRAVLGGALIGITTLLAFFLGLREFGYSLSSPDIPETVLTYARTMAFVVLAVSQLFYSLTMRSFRKPIYKIGLFSNIYLIGAILIGIGLQFIVISSSVLAAAFKVQMLSANDWALVFGLAIIPMLINEALKALIYKES